MAEDLPSDYDTIVVGTGMPECILAAAHARIGKQVLHIDRNEYYGGVWATFNFDGLERWMKRENLQDSELKHLEAEANYDSLLKEGEYFVMCHSQSTIFSNLKCHSYVAEDGENDNRKVETCKADEKTEPPSDQSQDKEVDQNVDIASELDKVHVETPSEDCQEGKAAAEPEDNTWTLSKIRSQYRKFNLDLAPKLLFSRGEMVDLLISSNIARYAEFKSVTRILTYMCGKLEQVPCSRADVFSTKSVSIVEKRMLMKLLTFCLNFEQHSEEIKDFQDRPFFDFLKSRNLTPNVLHYVINSIAMVAEDTNTIEGLKSCQRFLNSLGRYGNTPFLWPLYGSGELPQCFCRLCAVFGGIYYLQRTVSAVIVNSNNVCVGVISNGKRLNCKWLIMEASFAPISLLPKGYGDRQISRAILLTNKSVLPADKEQLTFFRFPLGHGRRSSVWVVELGASAMACPQDLYVVHLTSEKVTNAESDLQPVVDLIFDTSNRKNTEPSEKPLVLWSVYFNQTDSSCYELNSGVPTNLFLTSGPSAFIDFDDAVIQARKLFKEMFPDEDFLPKAPDPEDIVIEDAEVEQEPGFGDLAEGASNLESSSVAEPEPEPPSELNLLSEREALPCSEDENNGSPPKEE